MYKFGTVVVLCSFSLLGAIGLFVFGSTAYELVTRYGTFKMVNIVSFASIAVIFGAVSIVALVLAMRTATTKGFDAPLP